MNYKEHKFQENGGKSEFTPLDAYQLVKFNQFASESLDQKIKRSLNEDMFKYDDTHSAIYLLKSMINHSCLCNCISQDLGDYSYVLALEDIPQNTEITISYDTQTKPLADRQETFKSFGFVCKCMLCVTEMIIQR